MIPHFSPWEWVAVGCVAWAVVIAVLLLWWCKVRAPAAAAYDHAIKTYPGKYSTRPGVTARAAGRVDPEVCDVCGLSVPTESTPDPASPPRALQPTMCLLDHSHREIADPDDGTPPVEGSAAPAPTHPGAGASTDTATHDEDYRHPDPRPLHDACNAMKKYEHLPPDVDRVVREAFRFTSKAVDEFGERAAAVPDTDSET